MKHAQKHLLIAACLAVAGFSAVAQTAAPAGPVTGPGPGPGAMMRPGMMQEHMQRRMAQRQAALKQILQVTPAQEGAWNAWIASRQPSNRQRPNPAELARMVSSRGIEGGPPGALEDFTQVGDLLRETIAPPALRVALFKVASNIPGVLLIGPTTDHLGRRGIGLAIAQTPSDPAQGSAGLLEFIFDPTTSALLSEQTLAGSRPVELSANGAAVLSGFVVTSWTAYEASAVVDSTTAVVPTTASGH